jgi:Tfp pilus assembly protein PilO
MVEGPKLTGLKKRQQIQQANKTMFIWVAAASVALAICLVLAQFMVRQLMYNNKVIGEKAKTQQILDRNLQTFDTLKKEVTKLTANSDLTALRVADTDTALQVIIDALPTEDDRAVLGTSLQQVVLARSGVGISSINVTQTGVASLATAAAPTTTTVAPSKTPSEIVFDVVVVGNYAQIASAIKDMEHSIRPISINSIKLEGSGQMLSATISARTYYLPGKTVELTQKPVRP